MHHVWRRAGLMFGLALIQGAAAAEPPWLASYQETVTSDGFAALTGALFAPAGGLEDYTLYAPGAVRFFGDTARTGAPLFELRFAADEVRRAARPPAAFKDLRALEQLDNKPDRPLDGLRIALDPGHIGGRWARMEERFFVGDRSGWFVQEAALNLEVARHLRMRLEAAGALVVQTKDNFEPVTAARPADFTEEARRIEGAVERYPDLPPLVRQAELEDRIGKRQEFLFYRREEIRARALRVNREFKPDLTVCLHFNAVETAPGQVFTDRNAVVVFIHGNYLPGELASAEMRERLVEKLLSGAFEVEREAAGHVARALAKATGLPASGNGGEGGGGGSLPVSDGGYVCARNLAANRLIDGPVLFTEAYYMNHRTVFRRIQAGDYEGVRVIDGGDAVPSIFREYADAVADGLIAFYRARTVRREPAAPVAAP